MTRWPYQIHCTLSITWHTKQNLHKKLMQQPNPACNQFITLAHGCVLAIVQTDLKTEHQSKVLDQEPWCITHISYHPQMSLHIGRKEASKNNKSRGSALPWVARTGRRAWSACTWAPWWAACRRWPGRGSPCCSPSPFACPCSTSSYACVHPTWPAPTTQWVLKHIIGCGGCGFSLGFFSWSSLYTNFWRMKPKICGL